MTDYVFTYGRRAGQTPNMDHAVAIAQGCPAIAQGYGLEVGELMAM